MWSNDRMRLWVVNGTFTNIPVLYHGVIKGYRWNKKNKVSEEFYQPATRWNWWDDQLSMYNFSFKVCSNSRISLCLTKYFSLLSKTIILLFFSENNYVKVLLFAMFLSLCYFQSQKVTMISNTRENLVINRNQFDIGKHKKSNDS